MSSVIDAARLLEARHHFEHVPFERYGADIWTLVDEKLPGFGPPWLREAMMRFRIGGASFRLDITGWEEWKCHCNIPRPSNALWFVYHPRTAWVVEGLFKSHVICFAHGSDYYDFGWAFRDDGNSNPDVFLFERSAWDGGEASEDNGLLRIGMTMSEFLTYGAKSISPTTAK